MSKVTGAPPEVEPPAAPRTRPAAFTLVKALAPFVLAGLILLIPRPEAVQAHGWAVFAIFAGTILGLILRPLPLGAVALIGLTATMLSKTLEPDVALSGFGNATIWLIVCAFFIAKGFAVTGLGRGSRWSSCACSGGGRSAWGTGWRSRISCWRRPPRATPLARAACCSRSCAR